MKSICQVLKEAQQYFPVVLVNILFKGATVGALKCGYYLALLIMPQNAIVPFWSVDRKLILAVKIRK